MASTDDVLGDFASGEIGGQSMIEGDTSVVLCESHICVKKSMNNSKLKTDVVH